MSGCCSRLCSSSPFSTPAELRQALPLGPPVPPPFKVSEASSRHLSRPPLVPFVPFSCHPGCLWLSVDGICLSLGLLISASVSLFVSPCLSLSISLCLSISSCPCLSLSLSRCLFFSLCFSISLSLSEHLSLCLPISLCLPMSLSPMSKALTSPVPRLFLRPAPNFLSKAFSLSPVFQSAPGFPSISTYLEAITDSHLHLLSPSPLPIQFFFPFSLAHPHPPTCSPIPHLRSWTQQPSSAIFLPIPHIRSPIPTPSLFIPPSPAHQPPSPHPLPLAPPHTLREGSRAAAGGSGGQPGKEAASAGETHRQGHTDTEERA